MPRWVEKVAVGSPLTRIEKVGVTTRVFVQPKNTNFLKFFLQCVLHVVARSNPSQIPSFLDQTSRLGRRNLVHTNSLVAYLSALSWFLLEFIV
jgi:ATP-dependent helicase YprA (DUF1998 family)